MTNANMPGKSICLGKVSQGYSTTFSMGVKSWPQIPMKKSKHISKYCPLVAMALFWAWLLNFKGNVVVKVSLDCGKLNRVKVFSGNRKASRIFSSFLSSQNFLNIVAKITTKRRHVAHIVRPIANLK